MGLIDSSASEINALALKEQVASPTADPLRWLLHTLPLGLYLESPAGVVTGPFTATGGAPSYASITLTGTGGAGYLHLPEQASKPATPTNAVRLYASAADALAWVNESGFAAALQSSGLSADRVFTLPNFDGTLATLAGVESLSNKTLSTPITLSGAPFLFQPASNSTNAIGFANAAGTQHFYYDSTNGVFSIAAVPAADSYLKVSPTSVVTSGSVYGVNAVVFSNPAGASSAAVHGFQAAAFITAANAQNHTGSLRGLAASYVHQGTATLTLGIGVRVQNQNTSTGTVTTSNHFRAETMVNSGGGTVTNNAIFVSGAQTVGTNNTYLLLGTTTQAAGNWGAYIASANDNAFAGKVSFGQVTAPAATLDVLTADAGTNAVVNVAILGHTGGTTAAGFGTGLLLTGEDSTTANASMARLRTLYTTVTHASYATRSVISGYDSTGERDVIGWGASGSASLVGFHTIAAAPVIQYATTGTVTGFTASVGTPVVDASTFTGNTGATAYTIGDIVRALKLVGLMAA